MEHPVLRGGPQQGPVTSQEASGSPGLTLWSWDNRRPYLCQSRQSEQPGPLHPNQAWPLHGGGVWAAGKCPGGPNALNGVTLSYIPIELVVGEIDRRGRHHGP